MDPLDQPPDATPPSRSPSWPLLVVGLLAAAGAGVWYVVSRPRVPPEAPPAVDAGVPRADAGPTLSVEDGDALLARLASTWSADPLVASWLEQLVVRRLVAATQLVADGSSPRPALPFLSLSAPFAVREEAPVQKPRSRRRAPVEPRLFIAPESYARFDGLVAAFASIDASAAGEAWGRLRPFCDVAFAEIGRPGQRFDDVLTAAIRRLDAVRVPEGDVELVATGAVYAFKDPALEGLSAAEKHLLRMGPRNAQLVQRQLRAFAQHAGVELPEPRP